MRRLGVSQVKASHTDQDNRSTGNVYDREALSSFWCTSRSALFFFISVFFSQLDTDSLCFISIRSSGFLLLCLFLFSSTTNRPSSDNTNDIFVFFISHNEQASESNKHRFCLQFLSLVSLSNLRILTPTHAQNLHYVLIDSLLSLQYVLVHLFCIFDVRRYKRWSLSRG